MKQNGTSACRRTSVTVKISSEGSRSRLAVSTSTRRCSGLTTWHSVSSDSAISSSTEPKWLTYLSCSATG